MEIRDNLLDFNKICRLCLTEETVMSSIYNETDTETSTVPLPLRIMACVSIEITSTDGLPSQICATCLCQVDGWYKFKDLCENADSILRKCMKNEPIQVETLSHIQNMAQEVKKYFSSSQVKEEEPALCQNKNIGPKKKMDTGKVTEEATCTNSLSVDKNPIALTNTETVLKSIRKEIGLNHRVRLRTLAKPPVGGVKSRVDYEIAFDSEITEPVKKKQQERLAMKIGDLQILEVQAPAVPKPPQPESWLVKMARLDHDYDYGRPNKPKILRDSSVKKHYDAPDKQHENDLSDLPNDDALEIEDESRSDDTPCDEAIVKAEPEELLKERKGEGKSRSDDASQPNSVGGFLAPLDPSPSGMSQPPDCGVPNVVKTISSTVKLPPTSKDSDKTTTNSSAQPASTDSILSAVTPSDSIAPAQPCSDLLINASPSDFPQPVRTRKRRTREKSVTKDAIAQKRKRLKPSGKSDDYLIELGSEIPTVVCSTSVEGASKLAEENVKIIKYPFAPPTWKPSKKLLRNWYQAGPKVPKPPTSNKSKKTKKVTERTGSSSQVQRDAPIPLAVKPGDNGATFNQLKDISNQFREGQKETNAAEPAEPPRKSEAGSQTEMEWAKDYPPLLLPWQPLANKEKTIIVPLSPKRKTCDLSKIPPSARRRRKGKTSAGAQTDLNTPLHLPLPSTSASASQDTPTNSASDLTLNQQEVAEASDATSLTNPTGLVAIKKKRKRGTKDKGDNYVVVTADELVEQLKKKIPTSCIKSIKSSKRRKRKEPDECEKRDRTIPKRKRKSNMAYVLNGSLIVPEEANAAAAEYPITQRKIRLTEGMEKSTVTEGDTDAISYVADGSVEGDEKPVQTVIAENVVYSVALDDEKKLDIVSVYEVEGKTVRILHQGKYKCLFCECELISKQVYDRHVRKNHLDYLKCKICANQLYCIRTFVIHLSGHMKILPYKCTICDKSISTAAILKDHMARHYGDTAAACPICQKSCSNKWNLQKHMKTIHGTKVFICELCGFTTKYKNSLEYHIRQHPKEKDSLCEICGKLFLGARNVALHVRSHNKEHRCVQCDKKFGRAWWLKRHVLRDHGSGEKLRRRGGGRKNMKNCAYCERKYQSLDELEAHFLEEHSDELMTL